MPHPLIDIMLFAKQGVHGVQCALKLEISLEIRRDSSPIYSDNSIKLWKFLERNLKTHVRAGRKIQEPGIEANDITGQAGIRRKEIRGHTGAPSVHSTLVGWLAVIYSVFPVKCHRVDTSKDTMRY